MMWIQPRWLSRLLYDELDLEVYQVLAQNSSVTFKVRELRYIAP